MNPFHIHGCSVYSIPQVVSRPYPKLYPDYASIVYNWTPQQNVGLTPNSGKKKHVVSENYMFVSGCPNVYKPILAGKMRSIDGSTTIFTNNIVCVFNTLTSLNIPSHP